MGLSYATPVDLWACGCIFAELHTRTALFDGKYEKDQLAKIFGVLGTPADEEWPENAAVLKSNFASMPKKALSELVPELEPQGEDLLEVCIVIVLTNFDIVSHLQACQKNSSNESSMLETCIKIKLT